jgi:predicted dehydrogenase
VGLGSFWLDWALAMGRSTGAEYAAVCDIDPKRLKAIAGKLNVPEAMRFTDVKRALREVDPDFVLAVVPPVAHREVALAAIRAGKHVLTEKPMALTRRDALAMVRAAEQAGVQLAVDQNYRFNPWIRKVRSIVASGRLGRVSHVVGSFRMNAVWGEYQKRMEHPLLTEMSIHHFDNFRFLLGEDASEVFAKTWNPPWSWSKGDVAAAVTVTMRSGVACLWEGTVAARGETTGYCGDWRIECEKGALHFDFTQRDEKLTMLGRLFVTRPDRPPREVHAPAMRLANQDAVLDAFVRSIRTGKPMETHGRDNLKSLDILLAALRSARTRWPVRIPQR